MIRGHCAGIHDRGAKYSSAQSQFGIRWRDTVRLKAGGSLAHFYRQGWTRSLHEAVELCHFAY